MDEKIVFHGYLTRRNSSVAAYAELSLPAAPYELRDAMERAQINDGADMFVELSDYTDYPFLEPYLENVDDLYALNALAERLATLEEWQTDALEGLVLMEEQKEEPFGLPRIYDLAASAGECQVLYDAKSDEELGRFYVDNDFVPETEGLPEAAYELLDYAAIGEKMRLGEGGIFLRYGSGYVTQTGDIKEEFKDLDLTPKAPDYTVLLEVGIINSGETVMVALPMAEGADDEVLRTLGAASWDDVSLRCADCRIPQLRDAISQEGDLLAADTAARTLAELTDTEATRFKMLLEAQGFDGLDDALSLIPEMEDYIFSPTFREPRDVALEELRVKLSPEDVEALLPHVNLDAYGRSLIERQNLALTAYGAVERQDGEPIQRQEQEQTLGEMTM